VVLLKEMSEVTCFPTKRANTSFVSRQFLISDGPEYIAFSLPENNSNAESLSFWRVASGCGAVGWEG